MEVCWDLAFFAPDEGYFSPSIAIQSALPSIFSCWDFCRIVSAHVVVEDTVNYRITLIEVGILKTWEHQR